MVKQLSPTTPESLTARLSVIKPQKCRGKQSFRAAGEFKGTSQVYARLTSLSLEVAKELKGRFRHFRIHVTEFRRGKELHPVPVQWKPMYSNGSTLLVVQTVICF